MALIHNGDEIEITDTPGEDTGFLYNGKEITNQAGGIDSFLQNGVPVIGAGTLFSNMIGYEAPPDLTDKICDIETNENKVKAEIYNDINNEIQRYIKIYDGRNIEVGKILSVTGTSADLPGNQYGEIKINNNNRIVTMTRYDSSRAIIRVDDLDLSNDKITNTMNVIFEINSKMTLQNLCFDFDDTGIYTYQRLDRHDDDVFYMLKIGYDRSIKESRKISVPQGFTSVENSSLDFFQVIDMMQSKDRMYVYVRCEYSNPDGEKSYTNFVYIFGKNTIRSLELRLLMNIVEPRDLDGLQKEGCLAVDNTDGTKIAIQDNSQERHRIKYKNIKSIDDASVENEWLQRPGDIRMAFVSSDLRGIRLRNNKLFGVAYNPSDYKSGKFYTEILSNPTWISDTSFFWDSNETGNKRFALKKWLF